MNRILPIAILLLTLLTTEEMRAQDMINETGYKCNDGGLEYISPIPCDFVAACEEECSSCQGFFDCDEIKSHTEGCYYECPRCEQQMTVIEGLSHYCDPNKEGFCCFCGKPIDQCECSGPVIPGNYPSSGGGGGGGGGGGPTLPIIPPSSPTPTTSILPILHSSDTTHIDSTGYHRCPCMISPTKKAILEEMKNSPWYNQDNGYPYLTEDLRRQVEFPSSVQQGQNGTCGAAAIQKWLAENYPEQYIECVYRLANYGCYEPWGLWLDKDDKNPIGMTQVDVEIESGNNDKYKTLQDIGAQYTSVDAIMQSAIQTWAYNNEFVERWWHNWGFGTSGYDPREDDGNGGGMTYGEITKFMEDVAGKASIINNNKDRFKSQHITYDKLEEWVTANTDEDFDSYTVFASVNIVNLKDGKYFGDGKLDHFVEINGLNSGKIDFWSYGWNYTTSEVNCPVGELLILKNTKYGKEERAYQKANLCHCTYCNGHNCDGCICMQK